MTITRIIFERGIEVSTARNSVKIAVDGLSLLQVFEAIWSMYQVRPVLLTEDFPWLNGTTRDRHAVLSLDGKEQLNLKHFGLELSKPKSISTFIQAMNVNYLTGSLLYHCQQLALHYVEISDMNYEMNLIRTIEGNRLNIGGQREAYYEVESLITSARRAYDALRYILWKVFGPGGKDTPSNFIKTVKACDAIPDSLRIQLTNSWESFGVRLTAYRDCIQHYVPVSSNDQSAQMKRLNGDIWLVLLRLPDNPEVKSQQGFKYAGNVDALTYCWELTNEVFKVAASIFASIPTQ